MTGGNFSGTQRPSGAGGSGLVVIRYPASSGIFATGGEIADITDSGTAYRVHRFTASTDFVVTEGSGDVEYLLVGGGGGGGLTGGGAGGQVLQGTVNVSVDSYPVIIGVGGASRPGSSSTIAGLAGTPSSAFGLSAAGGVGGLAGAGGGGGGAGGVAAGTAGGPGLFNQITGKTVYYAAGGGQGVFASDPDNFGGIQGSGLSINSDGSPLSSEQDFLDTVSACNVDNAWFKIREPAHVTQGEPRREFVFLRGTDNNRILIKYSRASGFTEGGLPNACPTTGTGGDGMVVSNSTSLDSAATSDTSATLFSNVTLGRYLHIVLDNENVYGTNGGFPFWVWTSRSATGLSDWAMVHENVAPGTTSSLDQDPTYRVCTPSPANFFTATGVRGNWWEAYGLADPVYRRSEAVRFCHQIHGLSWSASVQRFVPPPTVRGFSPYEGQVIFYPLMVGIPGALFKGYSTGVTCSGFTVHNVLDVFKINTNNPRILVYLDPNQRVSVFFPWLPNQLPLL